MTGPGPDRRRRFLETLGRLPEPSELAPAVTEVHQDDGLLRERVEITTSPGVRVPLFVLRQSNPSPPRPAVLCIHQHNGEYHLGKSEPAGLAGNPDLAFAVELARRGYVTVAPDLDAFEDRQATEQERRRWGERVPTGSAYERFIATRCLQHGSTLQARYVWDLARTVDYLTSRPEVDPARIGAIGHSLGGQEVAWAMLFDERIRAGVCSCGVGTFRTIFRDGINHNMAAYTRGLLEVGDMDELVSCLAPRPFMMTAGASDPIFPIDGVRTIAAAASGAYRADGASGAFRFVEFPAGHGCPPDVREECYRWLDQWLDVKC